MGRYCLALTIIVTAAIVVPPEAAARQAGTAGATRPRLRVLQALPEAQLFPIMNLVADSLGVRCDYCHVQDKPDLTRTPANVGGWVWDSDDKPQKQVARDMMRMVVDLNATRFGGSARVTCFTCHRGATQPERLPHLPLPSHLNSGAGTLAVTKLPSADRIWTNYLNAVGPLEAPAPGTGTIISGWDERSEGRYGTVEIVLAGDRYRATVTTPAAITRQGFDGDVAWQANGDRVQVLSGENVARLRRIAMRYRPVKDRPASLQVAGVEPVNGRETYVLTTKIDATTTLSMYFDVVTGLLRREVTTTETLLLPLQEQIDYDDYRDVNGVQFPFRVRTSSGAEYDEVARTFLQIRRNVAVDDAMFRPK